MQFTTNCIIWLFENNENSPRYCAKITARPHGNDEISVWGLTARAENLKKIILAE